MLDQSKPPNPFKRGSSRRSRLRAWYVRLGSPTHCPVFGFEFVFGPLSVDDRPTIWRQATIDRIDSRYGYVDGNVQVISFLANQMKADASPEQLIEFAKWILKQHG